MLGAILLLGLPHSVFKAAVPALIAVAAVLMALQPRISAGLERRGNRQAHGGVALMVGVFLTGIYGGYFGAAQGVILIALLAIFIDDDLQRLNGTKNALALTVNAVAGVFFVATTHVSWSVAGLIAAGSVIGGQVGGRYGRRLPAPACAGPSWWSGSGSPSDWPWHGTEAGRGSWPRGRGADGARAGRPPIGSWTAGRVDG